MNDLILITLLTFPKLVCRAGCRRRCGRVESEEASTRNRKATANVGRVLHVHSSFTSQMDPLPAPPGLGRTLFGKRRFLIPSGDNEGARVSFIMEQEQEQEQGKEEVRDKLINPRNLLCP